MRKFFKKYYVQLIVISSLGAATIIMVQQSFSVANSIKTKSVELKQIKMDQVLAEEYLQNAHEFKKNAQYIDENNYYEKILLPNSDDEKVRLFSTIEDLAGSTGNDNIVLAVKGAIGDPAAKTDAKAAAKTKIVPQAKEYLALNISLMGDYNDLMTFLNKLENLNYFSDVITVKVSKIARDAVPKRPSSDDVDDDEEDVVVKNYIKSEITVVFYLDAA